MWKTVISLSIYSMLLLQNGFSQQLKNITKNIFGSGNHVEMLPVAFGDFNSDKLTDIFVLNQDRNKLSILLAREQTFTLALTSRTYFQFPSEVDKKKLKLECTLNNVKIESVIPGDFDGDGGMDIFVTIKDDDDDETLADKVLLASFLNFVSMLKDHTLLIMNMDYLSINTSKMGSFLERKPIFKSWQSYGSVVCFYEGTASL